jgi:hypothetical protein
VRVGAAAENLEPGGGLPCPRRHAERGTLHGHTVECLLSIGQGGVGADELALFGVRMLPRDRDTPSSSPRPRPPPLVGADLQPGVQGGPEAGVRRPVVGGRRAAPRDGARSRSGLALLGVRRRPQPGEPQTRAARATADALGVAEGLLARVRDGAPRAPLCGAVGIFRYRNARGECKLHDLTE